MPTGNGFGYAVVDPTSGTLIRFFAHPYRFMSILANVRNDGSLTTNLIQKAAWESGSSVQGVSYLEQSHIIHVVDEKSTAHFFMPFTLERNVLVATNDARDRCLAVTRQNPVHSHQRLDVGNWRVEAVRSKNVPERIDNGLAAERIGTRQRQMLESDIVQS
jgi:hypothetical protein